MYSINSVRLKNFRCFRDGQTARIAPLTLLVGENSTGKTSFLALIRALWNIAFENEVPDFKKEPYDLGSFDEIAYHPGTFSARAKHFEATFEYTFSNGNQFPDVAMPKGSYSYAVIFERSGTVPVPISRRVVYGDVWYEESLEVGTPQVIRLGTSRGSWKAHMTGISAIADLTDMRMWPLGVNFGLSRYRDSSSEDFSGLEGSPRITGNDVNDIEELIRSLPVVVQGIGAPYASSPVRSRPRRTYDPARVSVDSEGEYVPMYLANMDFQDNGAWKLLKEELERFGQASGLFDEINIKQLGKRQSEPFQLQIRKRGRSRTGALRNVIDVGYGVSQVLPVITELLRPSPRPLFLLQQPEVHLHPSAQAALGSLFCKLANRGRQLIVETHSDHLLDRVRMDVRDEVGDLKPEDVSILYFERDELDVKIHSLRLDTEGNILDAPSGYRQFFLEETKRSVRF